MTYIQEAQSTPQTPTSTTTTNSVSGGSIGTGGGGASPDSEQNGLGTTNKVASATVSYECTIEISTEYLKYICT